MTGEDELMERPSNFRKKTFSRTGILLKMEKRLTRKSAQPAEKRLKEIHITRKGETVMMVGMLITTLKSGMNVYLTEFLVAAKKCWMNIITIQDYVAEPAIEVIINE